MSLPRIAFLQSQETALTSYLESHPLGHERGAIVLFRRLSVDVENFDESDRYIAVEVIPFEDSWVTSSSHSHVAFELRFFRELFRRCQEESLVFGFAHNHPGGLPEFSGIDEENEITLLTALSNRNGPEVHFVALLLTHGVLKARVRHGAMPSHAVSARHVIVLGRPLRLFLNSEEHKGDELYARQSAAFGQPFVSKLRSLRIAVIGAGGTGSPVITLLARAGIGEIVVIDGDTLERSNLNRVRGACAKDVGQNKAKVLKKFVDGLELPVLTAAFDTYLDLSPVAIDALASCDVIFGCTDDQIGREVLNTSLYVYAQAYIDLGLGGQVSDDEFGHPHLRYHYGRVSTILPEEGECLFCQGIIKDTWIRHQYAVRQDPELSESEASERYLQNGGEQAPGVAPFTGAVADYGVATLFDLLRPFRKYPPEIRNDFFKIDFVRMEIRSNQEKNDANCPYCRKKTYLLAEEQYRLGRPALGKRNVHV